MSSDQTSFFPNTLDIFLYIDFVFVFEPAHFLRKDLKLIKAFS